MLLTQQFLSILAISTAVSFLFVVMFEAPIVHIEKLIFVGVGKRPPVNKPNDEDKVTDIKQNGVEKIENQSTVL